MSDSPASALPSSDAAPSPAPADTEIESLQSKGLGTLLDQLGISLVVSTYQAGKLIVMRNDGGLINTHFKNFSKPMGVAVHGEQLALGVIGELLFFSNVPGNCAKLMPPGRHDACYVQRYAHLTGEIDVHEMAFGGDGQIWFINTRFSALCTINGQTSFHPVWRPSFVSAYAAEDRCHLNGLGLVNGRPRFVTALGESDAPMGWRERKADGGVLIDLATNQAIARGLSMPHSPRWYLNHLWFCESGKGTLSRIDPGDGAPRIIAELPGFTRGLDFHGPYAFVGLSQIRETATFSGIPIADKAGERNCGLWIVDLRDGSIAGCLRFTAGVEEIFAVQVIPGRRFPELLEKTEKLARETYFLPPEILKDLRETPVTDPR